jgi:hypothetical protein
VLDAGLPAERVHVVLDELAAAHAAIDRAAPGDLVVIFVDRVKLLWESLKERAAPAASGPVTTHQIPNGLGNGFHPSTMPGLPLQLPGPASVERTATA